MIQIKVKISITTDKLFPSVRQKRMRRKTKRERKKPQETIKSRRGAGGSQNRAQILSDGHAEKLAGMTVHKGLKNKNDVNTLLCFDAVTSLIPKMRKDAVYKRHTIL